MIRINNSIYIVLTITFTVLGQVLTKKGQSLLGKLPIQKADLPLFLIKSLFTPYIFFGLLCAIIAALSWIMVLYKFKLSFAYPFMSLSYILVMIASIIFFDEKIFPIQWVGVLVIGFGIFLISKAY